MGQMAASAHQKPKNTKANQARKWNGGPLDADPLSLPQRVSIPAVKWHYRAIGIIRFATIYADAVKATDSSPIFGHFCWEEPVTAYRGVAMRTATTIARPRPVVLVDLVHKHDPERDVTLHACFEGADVAARWRGWSRALGLPLLTENGEGELEEAETRLGALKVQAPQPHSGANPLSTRRPVTFGQTGQPRFWTQRLMTGTRPTAY